MWKGRKIPRLFDVAQESDASHRPVLWTDVRRRTRRRTRRTTRRTTTTRLFDIAQESDSSHRPVLWTDVALKVY